jgi:hypothetical protein
MRSLLHIIVSLRGKAPSRKSRRPSRHQVDILGIDRKIAVMAPAALPRVGSGTGTLIFNR